MIFRIYHETLGGHVDFHPETPVDRTHSAHDKEGKLT